ncbi:MAG: acyl-CoA/acyl-ACP dehydrogenase [Planctomycetota bacterium]|nr:acyl-CoA/acyl-ACP dehydrogenase [Planctomycetota bacterium]
MTNIHGIDATGLEFVATAAEIAAEIREEAVEVDKDAKFPARSLAMLAERGFFGLCIPADAGGQAQPPGVFAAVVEQLARACPSTAMIYVMHVSASRTFVASQTLADRASLLRDVAAGKHLTTLAFSERGSRSQFWAPVSQFEQDGNGGFVTSASKSWVTSANHADSYVSSAQKPGAASPLESTLYVARRGASGMKVTDSFDGLGLRGNDSAPVEITDLGVAAGELLTPQGDGAAMMLEVVLPWFSVGTAAMAHGICLAAVNATKTHLSGTGFEHDGSKLRDLPNLRARLAKMSCRTEQSRALLGFTAQAMLAPNEQTPLYVLQSRMSALEAAIDVTDLAMKACGGAAFSRHLGVEQMFRDARAGWVMAPTVDHLQEFVGRALTGMPLF